MLSRLIQRGSLRAVFFAAGALLAVGTAARPLAAAEADCKDLVGSSIRGVMKTGQKDQVKCHGTANKICVGGDPCNDPDDVAFQILDKGKLESKKSKALVKVNDPLGPCATAPLTTALFPGGALSNELEFFDDTLAAYGDSTYGADNLLCDETKVKCFATIAKNHINLADKMLAGALDCYAAAAAGTPMTGTTCLTTTEAALAGAIEGAREKINAVCADLGINGTDVGSCDPLPQNDPNNPDLLDPAGDCVTDGGIAEGKAAAVHAFPAANCSPISLAMGRTAHVAVNTPTTLAGVEIEFDYPNSTMGIPLNGDAIDSGRFSNFSVSGLFFSDLDSRLRLVANEPSGILSGQLVDVAFDRCGTLKLGSCTDDAGPVGARACNSDGDCKNCANTCTVPGGVPPQGEACVTNSDCGPIVGATCGAGGNVGANCNSNADCTGGTFCFAGAAADAPCLYTAPNGNCSVSTFQACDADAGTCPTGETCVSATASVPCTVTTASDSIGNSIAGVTCSVTLTEP